MCEGSGLWFSLCLTMRMCVEGCSLACVCVHACFPSDQQLISLLQWRFSLQITRKVKICLSQQQQLRVERSTVTLGCEGCIFDLIGPLIYFLVMTYFSLFSCWRSYMPAQWGTCVQKTYNAKKSLLSQTPHPSLRVWFDLYPFLKFLATALLAACRLFSHGFVPNYTEQHLPWMSNTECVLPHISFCSVNTLVCCLPARFLQKC